MVGVEVDPLGLLGDKAVFKNSSGLYAIDLRSGGVERIPGDVVAELLEKAGLGRPAKRPIPAPPVHYWFLTVGGREVVVACWNGSVYLLDFERGNVLARLNTGACPTPLSWGGNNYVYFLARAANSSDIYCYFVSLNGSVRRVSFKRLGIRFSVPYNPRAVNPPAIPLSFFVSGDRLYVLAYKFAPMVGTKLLVKVYDRGYKHLGDIDLGTVGSVAAGGFIEDEGSGRLLAYVVYLSRMLPPRPVLQVYEFDTAGLRAHELCSVLLKGLIAMNPGYNNLIMKDGSAGLLVYTSDWVERTPFRAILVTVACRGSR